MGGLCDMCLETKEKTTHFALYISGSEGANLCHDCEMLVVEFIRENARAALKRRRAAHVDRVETAVEGI
jgi:hypothetical protein